MRGPFPDRISRRGLGFAAMCTVLCSAWAVTAVGAPPWYASDVSSGHGDDALPAIFSETPDDPSPDTASVFGAEDGRVRLAGGSLENGGSAGSHKASQFILTSGSEAAPAEPARPLTATEIPGASAPDTAGRMTDRAGEPRPVEPTPDPLTRLRWAEASEGIDPGETLKDWTEGAGLVVAFCVVFLWIVRQWMAGRTLPGGPTAHLRCIESLSLPQRCRIHLVDVGGTRVLVTVDAAGVKSVTVVPAGFESWLPTETGEAPETWSPADREGAASKVLTEAAR